MATVRTRITALALAVSSVVLVLAGWALLAVLTDQLAAQGDAAARARSTELVEQLQHDALPATTPPVIDDGLVQVLAADATVLGRSSNLPPRAIARPADHVEEPHAATLTAPDDGEFERYRVWRSAVQTDAGVVTVLVGTSMESATEGTRTLRTSLFVGVPLMLALLGLGTWYVVGRSLSQVDRVRRTVEAIPEDDLSRRLEPGSPDEIGRLVDTMNRLLDRVHGYQLRQRDFVADASHELQSPLTAFRSQLEVAQAHPASADWPRLTSDLLEDADRMEELVHDLLLLASGDVPLPAQPELVELGLIVREVIDRSDIPRTVTVHADTAAPAMVLGDAGQLARLVDNLLRNALAHAATAVRLTVLGEAGWVVVRVADDGPGVPAEQADRVFERFFRGDAARARGASSARGTGLGLAIAQTLARRHGGDIKLVRQDGGATFVLRLPEAIAATS
jgi:signal transduction histidine kinase